MCYIRAVVDQTFFTLQLRVLFSSSPVLAPTRSQLVRFLFPKTAFICSGMNLEQAFRKKKKKFWNKLLSVFFVGREFHAHIVKICKPQILTELHPASTRKLMHCEVFLFNNSKKEEKTSLVASKLGCQHYLYQILS